MDRDYIHRFLIGMVIGWILAGLIRLLLRLWPEPNVSDPRIHV